MSNKPTYEELEQRVKELDQDIVKHKQIEEELRESQFLYSEMFEQSTTCIQFFDPDGYCLRVNPTFCKIFGVHAEDLIDGKYNILKDKDLMNPRIMKFVEEIFNEKRVNKWEGRYDIGISADLFGISTTRRKQIDIDTIGYPILDSSGQLKYVVFHTRDITERKQEREALRESEEKYRDLVENSTDVIFSMDMEGSFTFISKAIEDITGYTPQEVLGKPFHQYLYPDDLPKLQDHFRQVIAGNGKNVEYRIIHKTGKVLWVSSHSSANHHGEKVVGFSGKTTNINERKEAEKALRESEFFFSQMFEQSSTATCLYDPNGFILRVNSEFCKLFGVDEKVITDGRYNVFEDEAAKAAGIIPLMKRVFEKKKTNKWEFNFDIDLASDSTGTPTVKAGRIYLDVFGYPILDDDRELKYVVLQHYDITEKKKTQELLIQNEKMMSVGGLAAGMAHELNNPLGGIMQGTQNILRRFSPNLKSNLKPAEESGIDLEKLQQYMEKRGIHSYLNGILDSGKRASQIILSMLQFSRKSESEITSVNLVNLMENILELAGKDYNLKKKHDFRTIDIKKDFDSDLPLVPCTATEIEQVILNLLNNAAWAMSSEKGVDQPQINLRINTEKETVRIEIEDNGPGMDEETRKRVFEPFFTTKPVREGTGLGLSVSYMIITNNHNGTMEVESKLGGGTKFIIRLPLN